MKSSSKNRRFKLPKKASDGRLNSDLFGKEMAYSEERKEP